MLIINKAIHINCPENQLLYPMQCHLNCVHITEVPNFLAESPHVTTHATQLTDPINTAQLLIIPLKLSSVTSYFGVYSPNIAEYENEEIPMIHLTAEEPPWCPSIDKYSEIETHMLDH